MECEFSRERIDMHRLIKDRLEEHLKAAPDSQVPADFEQHLKVCEECREEITLMQEQVILLQALRANDEFEPRPGFYARVMERIEAQQRASVWSVFLEPVFGRRLVWASLTMIVLLGSFLAVNEYGMGDYQPASADAIMAIQEHPPDMGQDQQRDRDTILVTLATYHE